MPVIVYLGNGSGLFKEVYPRERRTFFPEVEIIVNAKTPLLIGTDIQDGYEVEFQHSKTRRHRMYKITTGREWAIRFAERIAQDYPDIIVLIDRHQAT